MWAWAALAGGLAVVIAADLAGGSSTIERRNFTRDGSDDGLGARDRRAQSLSRNFAAWHQAAVAYAQLVPQVGDGELDQRQIRAYLPASYAKAGAWRSTLADGTVRTGDDGATIAGIPVGEGAIGRFLAAAAGYSGFAGLTRDSKIAAPRAGGAAIGIEGAASDPRNVRITPGGAIADGDRNHVP